MSNKKKKIPKKKGKRKKFKNKENNYKKGGKKEILERVPKNANYLATQF